MKRSFLVLFSLVCLGVFAQDACIDDDFQPAYTVCLPDNTRDLVWYKKEGVNCTGSPPNPTYNLPCDISCDDGYYLPLGETQCAECQTGTFSIGGGLLLNSWYSWPSELYHDTYCYFNSDPQKRANCPGWSLQNLYVESGNINDTQTSVLEIWVNIIATSGHVKFMYRVDCELTFDGLTFEVDDQVVMRRVSYTNSYVPFEAHLETGFHILRWKYYKDISISAGDDAAFLEVVEISGLNYADDHCIQCPPGFYQNETAQDICYQCPLNTYSNTSGSSNCIACDDIEYSFEGQTSCTPRLPCLVTDYVTLYTACSAPGNRQQVSQWLSPMICDPNNPSSIPLPSTTTVPCGECNPGLFRDQNYDCVPCPNGESRNTGEPSCQVCGAGTAAIKQYVYSNFDDWNFGTESQTGCTGDCSTTGWRLRSTYIDSGEGHGNMVDSWFEFNVTISQAGKLTFKYNISCTSSCELQFTDSPYYTNVYKAAYGSDAVILPIGDHTLRWNFNKNGAGTLNRADRAMLSFISVSGSQSAGSPKCVGCSVGSISTQGESMCTNCTAGYTSDTTSTQCLLCPEGTYNPIQGSTCIPCGHGTESYANRTYCSINDCTYLSNGRMYDLSPLELSNAMYGPYVENGMQYFINVCSKSAYNNTCKDDDGNPIPSYACQITTFGLGKDIGNLLSYYDLPSVNKSNNLGLIINYGRGDLGCEPRYGVPTPRETNITFICDPTAGTGNIVGTKPKIENQSCKYTFQWTSLYACPLCSEVDYSFFYTPCQNNQREIHYYWTTSPPNCHGGVPLPNPVLTSCSESTTFCPEGQALNGNNNCSTCEAGSYSVGGGQRIESWSPLPPGFSTSCITSGCTGWSALSNDGYITSGTGLRTSLEASFSFVTAGSISFSYKLQTFLSGYFAFNVDNSRVTYSGQNLWTDWIPVTVNVSAGAHSFTWMYYNGRRSSVILGQLQGVYLKDVVVKGLDYHADQCTPCPSGTFSQNSGATNCQVCPANTYSSTHATQCTPCLDGQYSPPGSSQCLSSPQCTENDYQYNYGPCTSGEVTRTASMLQPQICVNPLPLPAPFINSTCPPCPPNMYRTEGEDTCLTCPDQTYYEAEMDMCHPIPIGHRAIRRVYFFLSDMVNQWPANFTTKCSGNCGENGWRFRGDHIDSGYHYAQMVDSSLNYTVTVEGPDASVSFYFNTFTTSQLNGLEFSVDGVAKTLVTSGKRDTEMQITIPLGPGRHSLVWNYHQEGGDEGYATLRNVVVSGVVYGGGAEVIPCEAGTFSEYPGADLCTPCNPGSFSDGEGKTECTLCPQGTYSPNYSATECYSCQRGTYTISDGSWYCLTDCKFSDVDRDGKEILYDLSALTNAFGPVYDNNQNQYAFSICRFEIHPYLCPTINMQPFYSHSCFLQRGDIYAIDAGNDLEFIPNSYSQDSTTTFGISLTMGNTSSLCPQGRSVLINFQCNLTSSPLPVYRGVSDEDACQSIFDWTTSYGCRACTDEDYDVVTTDCDQGTKHKNLIKKGYCNGPEVMVSGITSCSNSVEFNLGLLIALAVIFVTVVVVAIFFFVKNRRITKQYSRLVETRAQGNIDSHEFQLGIPTEEDQNSLFLLLLFL